MDQTQTTQTQQNNPVTNDFNITKQVNPSTLPTNQISNDLDALKKAEEISSPTPSSPSLTQPIQKKTISDPNIPQELTALHVQNPFTGE